MELPRGRIPYSAVAKVQTSSKDYKRSDKKAAAMEEIRTSPEEQFTEEPFTGMLTVCILIMPDSRESRLH